MGKALKGGDEADHQRAVAPFPVPLRDRRGLSLRARVRMPDSYGILLILVLAAILSTGLAGSRPWARLFPIGIQAGMLWFAQKTSGASRRLTIATIVFTVVAFATAIAAAVPGTQWSGSGISGLVGSLLVGATAAAVARRLLKHPAITGATILGAVCIYLLIGLFFAYVYGALGAFGTGFFRGDAADSVSNFIYFSYVTQTTVGYGDLVAGTRLGQMTAVSEALLGQVYLVTVVALLVGRVGVRRPLDDGP